MFNDEFFEEEPDLSETDDDEGKEGDGKKGKVSLCQKERSRII